MDPTLVHPAVILGAVCVNLLRTPFWSSTSFKLGIKLKSNLIETARATFTQIMTTMCTSQGENWHLYLETKPLVQLGIKSIIKLVTLRLCRHAAVKKRPMYTLAHL